MSFAFVNNCVLCIQIFCKNSVKIIERETDILISRHFTPSERVSKTATSVKIGTDAMMTGARIGFG